MGELVVETFERVWARLPRSLSSEALDRCLRIAQRVPDQATTHYLEFRLNGGSEIDVLTSTRDRSIVESLEAQLGVNCSEGWAGNLQVLRDWAHGTGALSRAPSVGFEYDTRSGFLPPEPEASMSVCIEPDYFSRHWLGLRQIDPAVKELGLAVFRRLLPEPTRGPCVETLARLHAALPPRGAVPHAAVMTARRPVVAKPYVVLPRNEVFAFLDEIDWPGSPDGLEALLETYYPAFSESVYLDLTVTDRVHERLGVVTSQFQHREADFSSLSWWRLPGELEYFKEELRDWVGLTEETVGGRPVLLRRWLDTKAVLEGGSVEYKAYLGFSPTRRTPFG